MSEIIGDSNMCYSYEVWPAYYCIERLATLQFLSNVSPALAVNRRMREEAFDLGPVNLELIDIVQSGGICCAL
ncbi:hypothetical protein J6590_088900 [Homalodisca vitripennis]|nr:hypothetical protein J6590_088900 [Homalodisca vitripennis]